MSEDKGTPKTGEGELNNQNLCKWIKEKKSYTDHALAAIAIVIAFFSLVIGFLQTKLSTDFHEKTERPWVEFDIEDDSIRAGLDKANRQLIEFSFDISAKNHFTVPARNISLTMHRKEATYGLKEREDILATENSLTIRRYLNVGEDFTVLDKNLKAEFNLTKNQEDIDYILEKVKRSLDGKHQYELELYKYKFQLNGTYKNPSSLRPDRNLLSTLEGYFTIKANLKIHDTGVTAENSAKIKQAVATVIKKYLEDLSTPNGKIKDSKPIEYSDRTIGKICFSPHVRQLDVDF